ncbi:MAG: hypothetical protein MUC36_03385 [Planctomycetes bacterium]|jgi:hypothetical protein|nr:hypothetical protein [Planctomycetota bacterium]
MPDPRRVFVPFVLATGLVAQLQPAAVLQLLQVRAGSVATATPPVGSSVWGAIDVPAQATNGRARWAATHAADEFAWLVQWSVRAEAWGSGNAVGDAGVRYELHAPAPGMAQLQVGWWTTIAGTGAVTCSIDLHDDGSVDASGAAVLPVVFTGAPLVVRARAVATASAGSWPIGWGSTLPYSGSADGQLSLLLTPTGVQTAVTQPACGAASPTLQVAMDFAGQLRWFGALPDANALGLLVLGLAPSLLPLPWSPGCPLGAAPDLVWWQAANGVGAVEWSLPVPVAVRPVALQTRLLALEPASWSVVAAPALRVDLQ